MVPAHLSEMWRAWGVPAAIVIGGSAGSIEALGVLMPALVAGAAVPVVVVVHLRPSEPTMLPLVLARRCALPVRIPDDKQPCSAGVVWLAPPDFHLLVELDRSFALSLDEPVHFSRPAIDSLFMSAADAWGPSLVAIVLSGANRDGADGARAVRERGGLVVVEDPATVEFPVMPAAAIAAADPQIVAARPAIAALLAEMTAGGAPA